MEKTQDKVPGSCQKHERHHLQGYDPLAAPLRLPLVYPCQKILQHDASEAPLLQGTVLRRVDDPDLAVFPERDVLRLRVEV